MSPLINTLIVASLTGSIILIATKHHIASLATSALAAVLVITTIPSEELNEDEVFQYSPGGRVTLKSPKKAKPAKPTPRRIQVATNNLPACTDPPLPPSDREMRDHIRNNGLYGIHGNLSCKRLQRGAVGDKGMLQPLNARNQLVKFLSVDQKHAKDPNLIPRKPV